MKWTIIALLCLLMIIALDASKPISAKEQAALNRLHDLLESQFEQIRRSVANKPTSSARRRHSSPSSSTCRVSRKPSGHKEEFTIADLTESDSEKRAAQRQLSKLDSIAEI